jgi:hypothetical protein
MSKPKFQFNAKKDINISIYNSNDRRERETWRVGSAETDSSISDPAIKRRKMLDYFHGNGQKEWEPKSNVSTSLVY